MSVRTNTIAGILVGILVAAGSAPLSAQDPVTRPDTAKANADKKAAADRAAAGIHTPDTSGYRAMGDSAHAAMAADCMSADSAARAGITTGNRPGDLPARAQGRVDTTRAADTAARRTDTTSAMAGRTATPCAPGDSARTGQTGAVGDTTRGAKPFNRDSAQTAPRQRGEDLPGTAGGTAPNTTPRDQNDRVGSDSNDRASSDSTRSGSTSGSTTTRGTTTPRAVTPPTTAAPR